MSINISTNITTALAKTTPENAENNLKQALEQLQQKFAPVDFTDQGAGILTSANWDTQINFLDLVADNISGSTDFLSSFEDSVSQISDKFKNIQKLSKEIIKFEDIDEDKFKKYMNEIKSNLQDIENISQECAKTLKDVDKNNLLNNEINTTGIFKNFDLKTVFGKDNIDELAETLINDEDSLGVLEDTTSDITDNLNVIKKLQNTMMNTIDDLTEQTVKLASVSTNATDKDEDESSFDIRKLILENAKPTLLSTANQSPQMIMSLL